MNRWHITLVALGLVVGGLIFAPARLLNVALERQTQGSIQLAEAKGYWWCGEGILQWREAPGLTVPLRWRVEVLPLLRLRLGGVVDADSVDLSGAAHLALGWRSVEVGQARVKLSSRMAIALVPLLAFLPVQGALSAEVQTGERLVLSPSPSGSLLLNGKAELMAEWARLIQGNEALGSYRIPVSFNGGEAAFSLMPLQAALGIEGQGKLAFAESHQFEFHGQARSNNPALVAPLLPWARNIADGQWQVDVQTGW